MRFRMLGPLEVQVDGSWSGITAAKWRTVLAVLLLQPGQVVSTERLITEVWPDETPNRATNLVSVYVHRLRRLIGDPEGKVLTTRAPGYQLLVGAEDIDASRFAQLAAEGRQALSGRRLRAGVYRARRGARPVAGQPGADRRAAISPGQRRSRPAGGIPGRGGAAAHPG